MKKENLAVELREEKGKGSSRRLRRAGRVPAVFYGHRTETIPLTLSAKEMKDLLAKEQGGSTFVNLTFGGKKSGERMAILKDIQVNPVTDQIIHADFYELLMDEKVHATVPVRFVGKPKGVEMGGVLQHVRRELEVKCFPKDFPDHIEVDVANLEIGQSVHINDVALPAGVEVPHDVNFTIAVVVGRKAETEEAATPEAAAGEGAAKTA